MFICDLLIICLIRVTCAKILVINNKTSVVSRYNSLNSIFIFLHSFVIYIFWIVSGALYWFYNYAWFYFYISVRKYIKFYKRKKDYNLQPWGRFLFNTTNLLVLRDVKIRNVSVLINKKIREINRSIQETPFSAKLTQKPLTVRGLDILIKYLV